MAVELTGTEASFTGTGVLSNYTPEFYALTADQVHVYVDDVLQTLGDDYTVAGLGDADGVSISATFGSGTVVYIQRVTPITQEVDTQNNETILEDVLDAEFDKLTMICQELVVQVLRTIQFPRGENGVVLPDDVTRANLLMGFDGDGDLSFFSQLTTLIPRFIQLGASAVSRIAEDKMREMPKSPQDFAGALSTSVDNTDRYAEAFATMLSGGLMRFPAGQNYPGHLKIAQSGVGAEGQGGVIEFDYSGAFASPLAVGLRPKLTGAGTSTVEIGGAGATQLRRHRLHNMEISGDDGFGNMADAAMLITNSANSSFFNLGLRDGLRTVDVNPQDGPAVTAASFVLCQIRCDSLDPNARAMRFNRSGSDVNYVTATPVCLSHINGPRNGYAVEIIGSRGISLPMVLTYVDCAPWAGVFVKDGHGLVGTFGVQIDTGVTSGPAIETDAVPGTDPCRLLFGNVRVGDQKLKYRRAVVTGSINGNVFTVTAIAGGGSIVVGDDVHGSGIDHTNGGADATGPMNPPTGSTPVLIAAQLTGPAGGTGTYQLSINQPTLTSRTFYVGPTLTFLSEMSDFFYHMSSMEGFSIANQYLCNPGERTTDIGFAKFGAGVNALIRFFGAPLVSSSVAQATGLRSGALQSYGGLAIDKNAHMGGSVTIYDSLAQACARLGAASANGGLFGVALGTVAFPDQDVRFDTAGKGVWDARVSNGVQYPTYTVAQLAALAYRRGSTVWCSDARNAGEGAGSGTGALVTYNKNDNTGIWRIPGVSTAVTA